MRRHSIIAIAQLAAIFILNSAGAQDASPDRTGCLHETIGMCLRSFGAVLSDTDNDLVQKQITERSNKIDVNGKHIGSNTIFVSPTIQGQVVSVDLTLNSKDEVAKITAMVSGTLIRAETIQDYDDTGIFDVMQILLGQSCVSDKSALYKLFHNQVSARLSRVVRSTSIGDTSASIDYARHVRGIQLCAAKLGLDYGTGTDTNMISEYNYSGVYSYSSITLQ